MEGGILRMSVNVPGFNWVDKDVMLHGVRCFGSKNSEYLVSIDIIDCQSYFLYFAIPLFRVNTHQILCKGSISDICFKMVI